MPREPDAALAFANHRIVVYAPDNPLVPATAREVQ
jgi:hypothetical protein